MRRASCLALAVLLVLGSLAGAAGAEEPPAELVRIRRQIEELEGRLKAVEAQQSDLAAQRQRLEGELRLAGLRLREWEAELGRAEEAAAAAAAAAEQARRELEHAIERLRLQVSMLAVLGRAGLSPLVLHAMGSARDVPERMTVTLALVEEERRRRDEVTRLAEARARSLSMLSQRRSELEALRAEGASRRSALEATRQRVEADLRRLEQQRRAGAAALAEAQEAETRLERLWGVVTERDVTAGSSARLLRGGMPWPVRGAEIVSRFGARRDHRYGTVTVSHGVVMAAPRGELARSVAAGKVAYAQFFKGYGNLVIVQHGGEVYSLYARLSSMLVRAGDRVAMSDPVGVVGPVEDEEGNFYLEIRVGKQAQDPLQWLRPVGK
ncbi:MAG TPA: peptidoglycan DD-metalloendopeptidase family protein [Thermoanaerobaculaceae bacterium]|nr:peptidoglycan DD-metalloendopeptidase family protein [Thermoanaerobaculaceae bacterium]HRS16328.1 peptidoglycan DD-metalloendopeptidase family protein [Thermoanaerobaculaceae bacterium]